MACARRCEHESRFAPRHRDVSEVAMNRSTGPGNAPLDGGRGQACPRTAGPSSAGERTRTPEQRAGVIHRDLGCHRLRGHCAYVHDDDVCPRASRPAVRARLRCWLLPIEHLRLPGRRLAVWDRRVHPGLDCTESVDAMNVLRGRDRDPPGRIPKKTCPIGERTVSGRRHAGHGPSGRSSATGEPAVACDQAVARSS